MLGKSRKTYAWEIPAASATSVTGVLWNPRRANTRTAHSTTVARRTSAVERGTSEIVTV